MLGGIFGDDGAEEDGGHDGPGRPVPAAPPARREAHALAGLRNQGGTCYLNSLLQVLYMLPDLRRRVYELELTPDERVALFELQGLFARLDLSARSDVDTFALTSRAFEWSGGQASAHQDVHELVTKLLERLNAELRGSEDEALVREQFIGRAKENEVRCAGCGHCSGAAVPFITLFAGVEGFATLEDSLEAQYRGEPERLEGGNAYKCEACEAVTDKELRARLVAAPPHLFINLNRFTFDLRTCRRVKVSSRFEFPAELDVQRLVEANDAGPPADLASGSDENDVGDNHEKGVRHGLYDLVAIISHAGSGYAGHYVCYVRTDALGQGHRAGTAAREPDDGWSVVPSKKRCGGSGASVKGKPRAESQGDTHGWGSWVKFDDTKVHAVSHDEISATFSGRSCAYMLLYRSKALPVVPHEALLEAVPPRWRDVIAAENRELEEAWAVYDTEVNTVDVSVLRAAQVSARAPHLVPVEGDAAAAEVLQLDGRQPAAAARQEIAARLGMDESGMRLLVLEADGPGLFAAGEVTGDELSLHAALGADKSRATTVLAIAEGDPLHAWAVLGQVARPVAFDLAVLRADAEPLTVASSTVFCAGNLQLASLCELAEERARALSGDRGGTATAVRLHLLGPDSSLQALDACFRASNLSRPATEILSGGVRLLAELVPPTASTGAPAAAELEAARLLRLIQVHVTPSAALREALQDEVQGHATVSVDPARDSVSDAAKRAADALGAANQDATLFRQAGGAALRCVEDLKAGAKLEVGLAGEERGAAAPAQTAGPVPDTLDLKLRIVGGSDALHLAFRGTADRQMSDAFPLSASSSWTVAELKAAALAAYAAEEDLPSDDPAFWRARLTNWAEEPQDVLPEAAAVPTGTGGDSGSMELAAIQSVLVQEDGALLLDDAAACEAALRDIGGDPDAAGLAAASDATSWQRAGGRESAAAAAALLGWWERDLLALAPLTLADEYASLAGSESILLEAGTAPARGAVHLSVSVWADGAAEALGDVVVADDLGADQLRAALAKQLLFLAGTAEGDARRARLVSAGVALAAFGGAVAVRELRDDSPLGMLPGPLAKASTLRTRAAKGAVRYPVPVVIQASEPGGTPPGKRGKGAQRHCRVWLSRLVPSAEARERSFEAPQEVSVPCDPRTRAEAAKGDSLAAAWVEAAREGAYLARYDAQARRWALVDRVAATTAQGTGAGAGNKKKKKKGGKKSGKAAGMMLRDGDFIGVVSQTDLAPLLREGLCGPALGAAVEACFDLERDIEWRAEEEAKRRQNQASKVKASRPVRMEEAELSLGGASASMCSSFD